MTPAVNRDPAGPAANPALEFAAILLRRWWVILGVFAVVTAVVSVGALRAPPRYQAEASLLVRIGREYVYRPEVGRGESARMPSLAEIVNSEVEILSSRDLAEQVVGTLGASLLYPDVAEFEPDPELARERAVRRFREDVSARPVLESSVIKVSFEHSDPKLAADAVNLLVERFKDKHIEVFSEARSARVGEQLARRDEELTAAEAALAAFKAENQVYDLAEQRRLLLGQRVRLGEALEERKLELAGLRLVPLPSATDEPPPAELPAHLRPEMKDELLRQLHDLERELREYEPPPADRLIEQASMRLLELELELHGLERDLNPESRRVQGLKAEIETVRTFLGAAERRAGVFDETRRRELQAGRSALEERIKAMQADLAQLVRHEDWQAREATRRALEQAELAVRDHALNLESANTEIRRLDQQERSLHELERQRESAEAALLLTRERLDEARLSEQLDREKAINVRVIEAAAAPVDPSGLPPRLRIALGAFVGLIVGVAIAMLLELFRPR